MSAATANAIRVPMSLPEFVPGHPAVEKVSAIISLQEMPENVIWEELRAVIHGRLSRMYPGVPVSVEQKRNGTSYVNLEMGEAYRRVETAVRDTVRTFKGTMKSGRGGVPKGDSFEN